MDKEIYLIHLDDYLGHIDDKLEMYDLLLELVRSLRNDLEAVGDAQALRTLCAYEQKAHELYENWGIPDNYVESGEPDCLAQLMEDELLPAGEDEDAPEDGIAVRLLRAVDLLTRSTRCILDVANEIAEYEQYFSEAIGRYEKPENACAD